MSTADLLSIIYHFFVFILAAAMVIAFAGASAACFRERKRRIAALDKTAASYPVGGIVLDAQLLQDLPGTSNPMHHKYSLRYTDVSGAMHRAFIGMSSHTPLYFTIGEAVPLRIFQQSVIVPDSDAFNPSRGTDGRLDCPISFRKWLGKPVDETGTVMLERDYQDIIFELNRTISSRQTAGWLLLIAAALTFLIAAGALIGMIFLF